MTTKKLETTALDRLFKANWMQWYGHVLRRNSDEKH